jgi:hypothetical protein
MIPKACLFDKSIMYHNGGLLLLHQTIIPASPQPFPPQVPLSVAPVRDLPVGLAGLGDAPADDLNRVAAEQSARDVLVHARRLGEEVSVDVEDGGDRAARLDVRHDRGDAVEAVGRLGLVLVLRPRDVLGRRRAARLRRALGRLALAAGAVRADVRALDLGAALVVVARCSSSRRRCEG